MLAIGQKDANPALKPSAEMMTKTATTAKTNPTGQDSTTVRTAHGSDVGRHTQASRRAAKQQGRRCDIRYPVRRIAGLHYAPKLTVEDVHEIRRTYRYRSRHANMRVLAERYGVSVATIFKIIRGKMWRFVPTASTPHSREPRNHMSRLTKKASAALHGTLVTLAALDPANPELLALIQRYKMTAHANAVS